jgi:hypothetical protein
MLREGPLARLIVLTQARWRMPRSPSGDSAASGAGDMPVGERALRSGRWCDSTQRRGASELSCVAANSGTGAGMRRSDHATVSVSVGPVSDQLGQATRERWNGTSNH